MLNPLFASLVRDLEGRLEIELPIADGESMRLEFDDAIRADVAFDPQNEAVTIDVRFQTNWPEHAEAAAKAQRLLLLLNGPLQRNHGVAAALAPTQQLCVIAWRPIQSLDAGRLIDLLDLCINKGRELASQIHRLDFASAAVADDNAWNTMRV